jgi:hypothetical protein
MVMKFYWHINHDVLFGCSDNIQQRVEFIKGYKPEEEIPIRLRLLREIKGQLPWRLVDALLLCEDIKIIFQHIDRAAGVAWSSFQQPRQYLVAQRVAHLLSCPPDSMLVERILEGSEVPGVPTVAEIHSDLAAVLKKARDAHIAAWEHYQSVLHDYAEEIDALHRAECPNCPWNGKTIFPK